MMAQAVRMRARNNGLAMDEIPLFEAEKQIAKKSLPKSRSPQWERSRQLPAQTFPDSLGAHTFSHSCEQWQSI
jgi:hypothetical protein